MKKIILIIFICILLETVAVSYPITLIAVTMLSIFIEDDAALLAFLTGILLDLFSLRLVGLSSIYFLALIYLGNRYRKKIHGGTFAYRFSYLFISYIIYSLLFYKTLNFSGVLITIILATATLLLIDKLFPNVGNKRRLAV